MRLLQIFLVMFACAISGTASANCQAVAKMVSFDGQVSVKPAGKVLKTSPGALPRTLCAGDEVHTFEGRALINDGRSAVALDRFSVVAFNAAGRAALDKGLALFEVKKRTAEAGVEVKTRLSVIGVKGTRFLVGDKNDDVSVVLDEGVVDIASTQGPVGLYREKTVTRPPDEDYESYARRLAEGVAGEQAAFEKYKTQVQREFVAYVENLTLAAGKELVTAGRIAVERDISGESAKAIKSLCTWKDKQH
ncbi:MAG: FecR domain-containing protein [Pseudomonadota bacterium]|nr:FecR domain-containing protein [Pseudomonadota bacterium]